MLKIEKIEGFNNFKSVDRKTQVILSHTSRDIKNYILSLKHRNNGEYKKVPHYVISKSGVVFSLMDDLCYSQYYGDEIIDKNAIHVVLENLGWFDKIPAENSFINWIGDIYKEKVFEKKWRDYFFWDYYTDEQINSCINLCNNILENNSIDKKFIGHNIKVDGISKFVGIVNRSNFNTFYTDLNPSFKFEYFKNQIENEPIR